jgi:hypothetical protein
LPWLHLGCFLSQNCLLITLKLQRDLPSVGSCGDLGVHERRGRQSHWPYGRPQAVPAVQVAALLSDIDSLAFLGALRNRDPPAAAPRGSFQKGRPSFFCFYPSQNSGKLPTKVQFSSSKMLETAEIGKGRRQSVLLSGWTPMQTFKITP